MPGSRQESTSLRPQQAAGSRQSQGGPASTRHPQACLSFSQSSMITGDGDAQRKGQSRWLIHSRSGSNKLARVVRGLIKTAERKHGGAHRPPGTGRQRTHSCYGESHCSAGGGSARWGETRVGWAACESERKAGQVPTCLPEGLHFRGLLTALASKPVHILGGCPHHLVCLELTLVLCSVHL